ncbi:hypothetical protein TNCV_3655801 [Trichonephila clavipes]|nr:hypothetical protein TNCV_3655801 [Trichonephila clavipes]
MNECRITEFFFVINFVKHVRSTSPDMMVVEEEQFTQSHPGRKHLELCGGYTPVKYKSYCSSHMSHQTLFRVLNENRLVAKNPFAANGSFESSRLSSPTAIG